MPAPGRPTVLGLEAAPVGPSDAALSSKQGSVVADAPVVGFADGAVVGSARLVRTPNGVNFTLSTSALTPGHAYTLWIVIFNEPGSCSVPNQCAPGDIGSDAAKPDMMYAAGALSGGTDTATFARRVNVGDVSGSINAPVHLPSYGLLDPYGAEIWLAVHDHGEKLPEFMPDMIKTIAGGCVNAGIGAPPWDLYGGPEFGRRGPNTCMTIQGAFFQP
ncbi:MAG TPA: hypothetical protein VML55_24575 [Planctomycetaceae bacterium]|nr:hypothetical protein [Planctomycetaceae bacterium]